MKPTSQFDVFQIQAHGDSNLFMDLQKEHSIHTDDIVVYSIIITFISLVTAASKIMWKNLMFCLYLEKKPG